MSLFVQGRRSAGILLHPSSLPSGRLDQDVWRWLDFLAEAGFTVWQMLPLGVPINGLSPYQCDSAFAVNPALFPSESPVQSTPDEFEQWYEGQRYWVDDYALFRVARQQHDGACWVEWPEPLRRREPHALSQFRRAHAAMIQPIVEEQHRLSLHWRAIRRYAAERGVSLFGDMPIFVAHDSADVWAHPERFLLDERGMPTFVAGVPPDYFSLTGQRWGNPHYNWAAMGAEGFRWWLDRLEAHFDWFDLVRIDHFRGLIASWMIPAASETAIGGYWQPVPGDALLQTLRQEMGDTPLVAEDLGVITPEVTALRKKYGLPGMAVLQFAFDGHGDNPHKPQNVAEDMVYYTGTHDNDTTLGWFSNSPVETQRGILQSLGIERAEQVVDTMLDAILKSRAALAVAPLQDILHLGSEARMNTPGTAEGNWLWRFQWPAISPGLASDLLEKLQQTERTRCKPTHANPA